MPDLSIQQGRSHDASVIIENLEGKTIGDARTKLNTMEAGQVKDVRDLVDQLLESGHDEDRQRYGAIKQAADIVYGEKLEKKDQQLLPDEAIDTALKPLELTEEEVEDEEIMIPGLETETLWQQPALKTPTKAVQMAKEAAKVAPPAEEVLKLEGKHEKLRKGQVATWLEKYGLENVKQGIMYMFGKENSKGAIALEKWDRFFYALKNNPDKLPSPELDDIRIALGAEVSSQVAADVLKDRIAKNASPLPDDQELIS